MISKGNYEYKNTKSIFGIKVIEDKKFLKELLKEKAIYERTAFLYKLSEQFEDKDLYEIITSDSYNIKARIFFVSKIKDKKYLEKIVKENPSDFQAYYYLGHIGYATQKYEEATRNFSLAIQYNPEYALSYYSIGLAFDKLREFHHSLPAYEQFLKMETDDNKYTQYAKTRIATIRAKK